MGTITTSKYAAINPTTGNFAIGSKLEIAKKLFEILIKNRQVTVQHINGSWPVEKLNSYSPEYTHDEMMKDVAMTIYSKLHHYGYETFRDIGF
jgi:hypothetical protein